MPFFVFTWSVCTSFSVSTPCHTNTHTDRTVKGCDSPRTLHTLVLLLCKWIILIIVSSLVFPFGFSFFSPNDKNCLLAWSNVTGSQTRKPTCEVQPHPLTPLYLNEGPKMFQSLVFYMYLSNVRKWGM